MIVLTTSWTESFGEARMRNIIELCDLIWFQVSFTGANEQWNGQEAVGQRKQLEKKHNTGNWETSYLASKT